MLDHLKLRLQFWARTRFTVHDMNSAHGLENRSPGSREEYMHLSASLKAVTNPIPDLRARAIGRERNSFKLTADRHQSYISSVKLSENSMVSFWTGL